MVPAILLLASCTHSYDMAVVERYDDHYYGRKGVIKLVKVREGDSITSVAKRYDASTRAIVHTNNLIEPYEIYTGQILKVPAHRFHKVAQGETLYGIAHAYGFTIDALSELNDIRNPSKLAIGQIIEIPAHGYEIDYREMLHEKVQAGDVNSGTKAMVSAPESKDAYNEVIVNTSKTVTTNVPKVVNTPKVNTPKKVVTKPVAGSTTNAQKSSKAVVSRAAQGFKIGTPLNLPNFMWPTKGEILARYGKKGNKFNEGINIAGPSGASIKAAADGRVIYTGNELEGYGELIILQHKGDILTAYAHNRKNLVKMGQKVRKGQEIAKLGKTGNVSSPQLHFSVRKGRSTVDPEKKA